MHFISLKHLAVTWLLIFGLAESPAQDTTDWKSIGMAQKERGAFDSAVFSLNIAAKQLRIEQNTDALTDVLKTTADALYLQGKYDTAITVLDEVLTIAIKEKDQTTAAYATYQTGRYQWASGKIEAAFNSYQEALTLSDSDEDMTSKVLNGIGTLYWRIKDYNSAVTYYYRSQDLKIKNKDEKGLVLVKNNIGMVYAEWGQIEKALDIYHEAMAICELNEYPFGEAYTYYNLGGVELHYKKYDAAIRYYQLGIEKYKLANSMGGQRICLEKLALIHKITKQYDEALEIYELLHALSTNPNHRALALNGLAVVAFETSDMVTAEQKAEESLATDKHDLALIIQNQDLLSKIYQARGNHRRALESAMLARTLNDSIFSVEKSKQFAMIETRYALDKKEQENQMLRAENKYQQQQIFQTRSILLVSAAGILLLFGVIFFQQRSAHMRQKHNRLLKHKNKEIKNQSIKIEQQNVELNELNKTKDRLFAIISHDLLSPLNYVSGMLDLAAKQKLSPEEQNQALPTISSKVNDMTAMITSLLEWSRQQFAGSTAQAVSIDIKKAIQEQLRLKQSDFAQKNLTVEEKFTEGLIVLMDPEHLKITLRNLLSNARKYSHEGGKVTIQTESAKDHICLIVSDQGVGMTHDKINELLNSQTHLESTPGTASEKGSGLGFGLSHHFVKRNGGHIEIESERHKGTTVRVFLRKG